jgi:hypothetical protein
MAISEEKLMKATIFALLSAFAIYSASEATMTANNLAKACAHETRKGVVGAFEIGNCLGYVGGVIDMIPVVNLIGGTTIACLPADGIEPKDAVLVFLNWLKRHPNDRGETARAVLLDALRNAYPCKFIR